MLHLVRALGLSLVPMAIDDAGVLPGALESAARRGVRAVVLTPRAQNPTGAAFDTARVRALRAVVGRHPELLVIEDDHCDAVAGAPARTLCHSRMQSWAIVRSASKALGPDLRLAVLCGDETTVSRVEGRQRLGSRWVSHLLQEVAARLWRDRRTLAALARAEHAYGERREALLSALRARGIAATGRSGLNVWVPVPEETAVVQHLAARGYAVRAGEVYRIDSPPAVRITTAALPVDEAPRVADALAHALAGGTEPSV